MSRDDSQVFYNVIKLDDERTRGHMDPCTCPARTVEGLSGILCMGGIIGKKERCDAPEERAQYSQCVAG